MANPRPNPAYQFKPGVSGNPGGRPRLPEDVAEARKLNRVEFDRIANRYLYMSSDEAKAALQRPDCPMIEKIVGTIIIKGIQGGDHARLGFLLDRILGKVKDTVEIENKGFGALPSREEALRILQNDYAMLPAPVTVVEDL